MPAMVDGLQKGNNKSMGTDDLAGITEANVQLGSRARAFEQGWLAGVVLGFLAIALVGYRRTRSRTRHRWRG